jgi:hypothetical protein
MLWKPVVVVNADNRVKKERMREIAAAAAKIGTRLPSFCLSSVYIASRRNSLENLEG